MNFDQDIFPVKSDILKTCLHVCKRQEFMYDGVTFTEAKNNPLYNLLY